MSPDSKSAVYLTLAVLGAAFPLAQFVPWLQEHGPNLPQLWHEISASRIAAFAWADVLFTVLTILFLIWDEAEQHIPLRWLAVAGCLCIGASFGLPLYLFLRERARRDPVDSKGQVSRS